MASGRARGRRIALLVIAIAAMLTAAGLAAIVLQSLREPQQRAPVAEQSISGSSPPEEGRVTQVIDGDTIVVEKVWSIRYLGIDTLELRDSPGSAMLAREASARNRELVQGRRVRLEQDREDRDRYGRFLRHVWMEDRLVTEVLLREGLGSVLIGSQPLKHSERLFAAQSAARQADLGIWRDLPGDAAFATSTPLSPGTGAFATRTCPISAVRADAARELEGSIVVLCLEQVRAQRTSWAVYLRPADLALDEPVVVISRGYLRAAGSRPEQLFAGHTVLARGRLESRDGKIQLVVRDLDDLRVIGAGP